MHLLSSDTIRRCFAAIPGHVILTADFDQIELRVAAALAGETTLIEAAKRGESLHKIAAVRLFGANYSSDQYRYTKNVNFGWLFGGGAKTLSDQAGIPFEEARNIIAEYTKAFPALTAYKRREQEAILKSALTATEYRTYKAINSRMWSYRSDTIEGRLSRKALSIEIDRLLYRKLGYAVTAFGRRLPVDAHKAYAVVNYKVQSTSRDIMAEALLRVMDDPELEPTVLLPIHDEILGMARKRQAEHIAQRYGKVMTTEFMGVPITASGKVYGKSWGHGYRKND
jgi:DNA polymerase-1